MPALSTSSPPIITQPRCPNCSTPMHLARIDPDKRGFDLRTFECPQCEHAESWVYKAPGGQSHRQR